MAIDYSEEKKGFIAELEAGEYDLDISTNRGMDYRDIEDSDFLAFRENLDSVSSKALIAGNFEK